MAAWPYRAPRRARSVEARGRASESEVKTARAARNCEGSSPWRHGQAVSRSMSEELARRPPSAASAQPRARRHVTSGARPELWHNAGALVSPRAASAWWQIGASFQRRSASADRNESKALPEWRGWPTPGPSEDSMLLKLRQARLHGHVDWVTWSRQATDSLPKSPHLRGTSRPMRTDEEWPKLIQNQLAGLGLTSSRDVAQALRFSTETLSYSQTLGDAELRPQPQPVPQPSPESEMEGWAAAQEPPLTQASAQQSAVAEAQRSWILLRAAYLAGAETQIGSVRAVVASEWEDGAESSELHLPWQPSADLHAKLLRVKQLTRELHPEADGGRFSHQRAEAESPLSPTCPESQEAVPEAGSGPSEAAFFDRMRRVAAQIVAQ